MTDRVTSTIPILILILILIPIFVVCAGYFAAWLAAVATPLLYIHTNKHQISGVVVDVGGCSSTRCAARVTLSNGVTAFTQILGPVMVGQTVYRQCWTFKGDDHVSCGASLVTYNDPAFPIEPTL